jgi:hypothetical protein
LALTFNGSFTLVKFVSKTVGNSDMPLSLLYLPRPPRVVQHKIEMILSVSCHPRQPRQVQSGVAVAGIIVLTFANGSTALSVVKKISCSLNRFSLV